MTGRIASIDIKEECGGDESYIGAGVFLVLCVCVYQSRDMIIYKFNRTLTGSDVIF